MNIPLKTLSGNFTPHFIDPSVVRLNLPASMHIHPMFHVSQVKLVHNNPFLEGKLDWQQLLMSDIILVLGWGETTRKTTQEWFQTSNMYSLHSLSQSGSPHQGQKWRNLFTGHRGPKIHSSRAKTPSITGAKITAI